MASSYNRNSGLIISINRWAIFNFKTTQSNLKNHLNYIFSQPQYTRKMVKICNRYICIQRELNFSFSFIFQVITLPVQFDDQNVAIYGGDGKCNVDFTKVQSRRIMEPQKASITDQIQMYRKSQGLSTLNCHNKVYQYFYCKAITTTLFIDRSCFVSYNRWSL